MSVIHLYIQNIVTQVQDATRQELEVIYSALAYDVENFEIIKRKQYAKTGNKYWLGWDGRKSFFNRRSKSFLTGLLPSVISTLRTLGIGFRTVDQRRPHANIPKDCSAGFHLRDGSKTIELYDFQKEVCNALLSRKRGVVKIATGGGKTECAIGITKALEIPTLFLTHRVNLLHQTAERFQNRLPTKSAINVGVIGDGIYEPAPITIATVQTLHNLFKRDKAMLADELKGFRMLFIDEAHRSGAKQFYEVASLCENAYFRLGLTATPFMAGNVENDMYLRGITGNIIANVSNKELIDRGLLAKPYFMFINVKQPDNIGWLTDAHEIYDHGITDNLHRNTLIARKVKALSAKYQPLVIVYKLKHGQNIMAAMKAAGVKAAFIKGDNDYAQRTKALKQLSEKKIDAVIATNIFDEGVDVKEINCVVMAAGNKSAPAIFQRAGRAMRKKEDGGHCLIVDFIDMTHEKLFSHSKERFDIVNKEAGFHLL